MATPEKMTIDGNEAAAWVAFRINEAIYPITPSSRCNPKAGLPAPSTGRCSPDFLATAPWPSC